MKTMTVYGCEYCDKFFDFSKNCSDHELKCKYNDKNKTCFTCENYQTYMNEKYCLMDLKNCNKKHWVKKFVIKGQE